MDIKDFILIGGGLLIAAVVAHGFWIAWRARRDPLRMQIDPGASSVELDDLQNLRGELPNGGARVVPADPEQVAMELDSSVAAQSDGELPVRSGRTEPRLGGVNAPVPSTAQAGHERESAAASTEPVRARVTKVIMPESAGRAPAQPPRKEPPRKEPPVRESPVKEPSSGTAQTVSGQAGPAAATRASRTMTRLAGMAAGRGGDAGRQGERAATRSGRSGATQGAADGRRSEESPGELIVVNVLAPRDKPFVGAGLVEGLRAQGLRYGDMNIFHRVDPMTRASLYSVANVVEPGTFDISDLDAFRSPGVCFFMKLPGPEQPMEAFEDMLKAARDLAQRLDADLKDEQRSVMTGQTVEHYRARIAEFCRRRMSMRA